MKSLSFIPVIFLSLTGFFCAGASVSKSETFPAVFQPENPSTNITVKFYGSYGCGHCRFFSASLQKDRIPYIFYDVTSSEKNNREMWDRLRGSGSQTDTAYFPVVDIEGTVLMSPDYEEFNAILKEKSGN